MFDFENFPVYLAAEELYSRILAVVLHPKIDRNIKDQFRRAGLSIVSNIAEGSGKFTRGGGCHC